jgi:predicted metalloprotease with PDZ domain
MSSSLKKPRRLITAILILALSAASIGWSQTVLQKIEQQIRQRNDPNAPTEAPAAEDSAEKPESGYVGFRADDRQDRGRGVRVLDVTPESPADKAGFQAQDLITSIAGVRTRQLSEMADILQLYQPGETIEFDIIRENQPQKLRMTFGVRPKGNPAANAEAIPAPQGERAAGNAPTTPKISAERLEKRIEELERRVAELEKKLEN